jgi:hypothetical protein
MVLIAVAIGGRLAWDLLRPLLAPLLVVAVLLGIFSLVIGRRRWW